jgi:hypothetical protein
MDLDLFIDELGRVYIDGAKTGLGVSQTRHGTELYLLELPARQDVVFGRLVWRPPQEYKRLTLPRRRYALDRPSGAHGKPGLDQFKADVFKLLWEQGMWGPEMRKKLIEARLQALSGPASS